MTFSVIIEKDEAGFFVHGPRLPGCHTQGDTREEAMDNIREAIALYLETITPEQIHALSCGRFF